MSKGDEELPTAATTFLHDEAKYPQGIKWNKEEYSHHSDWEHGTEFVRKSDAEEAIRQREEQVRQRVAELIQDKIEELGADISRQELRSEDLPEKKAVRVLGNLLEEIQE